MATWTVTTEGVAPTWTVTTEGTAPTWSTTSEGLAIAAAGLAMGVLALTYSGGQEITGPPTWTAVSEEA